MRRLVLVRHGESRWNAERRIQGQACNGLSDLGHEQAALTAEALAATCSADRVVVSDLQRAQETADPVAASLGVATTIDVSLRERDFGAWTGLLRHEAEQRYPDVWRRWATGEDVIDELGGESHMVLAERAVAALERIVDDLPDRGTAVVVTHGGIIWHGAHAFLALRHGVLGGVANASVTELGIHHDPDRRASGGSREVGRWIDRYNEVAHLPAELRTSFRPSETRVSDDAA